MKKLLLFVLLFGIALMVMRYFEEPTDPEAPNPIDVNETTTPPGEIDIPDTDPGETGTEGGNADPDETDPQEVTGLTLNGPFEGRLFESEAGQAVRSLVLRIKSLDSRTEATTVSGGSKVLSDVLLQAEAEMFEIGNAEEPQVRIDAEQIVFPRQNSDDEEEGSMGLEPDWVRTAEMVQLDVTLLTGPPFVPLSFHAESARLDARNSLSRTLFAPGLIVVDSDQLRSQGYDLTLALDRNSFSFDRDAEVFFLNSKGDQVTMRSAGTLIVRQLQGESSDRTISTPVRIEAHGGAELRLSGEEGGVIQAETIYARGQEMASGDFLLTRFEAEGDVLWASGGAEVRGDRAELNFTAEGGLSSWNLPPNSSMRLPLEQLQDKKEDAEPRAPHGFVRISGAGEMQGKSGDVRSFEVGGPALVELFDLDNENLARTTLRAAGEVSGVVTGEAGSDNERAQLRASGGVLLESPQGQLEAQELVVKLSRTEALGDVAAQDVLEITTTGGAKLVGAPRDGQQLTLISEGPLRATRRGADWIVNEARDVTLSVEPLDLDSSTENADKVFYAEAGKVEFFDPATGELRASDGVLVRGVNGVGQGTSITISPDERVELRGTEETPATFVGKESNASALHIIQDGGRTAARGKVITRFSRIGGPEFPGQDYEILCDELIAIQGISPMEDGSEVHTFDLAAKGSVDGRVGFGEESSTIRCDNLTGARREHWARDENGVLVPVKANTTIMATGRVASSLALDGSQVDLACGSLKLYREETLGEGEEDDAIFTILAQAKGDVSFDIFTLRLGSPVHIKGNGEQLSIDESLTGLLVPKAGEQVHLEGSLPGQETPYELDSDSIVFVGGDEIEAEKPVITVGDKGSDNQSITRFRARASRLRVSEETLRLEQAVHLETMTAAGVPWSLSAEEVEIQGGVSAQTTGPQLDQLRADGGVEIFLGQKERDLGTEDGEFVASIHAWSITGSTLSGTIRLEGFPDGSPAKLVTPAMITHAQWIEVDPEIQLIRRSGPGRMVPARQTVAGVPDWELTYSASYSFEDHETDSFVFVIDQPIFESKQIDGLLRSTVALFWFDKVGWQGLPERMENARGPNSSRREEALSDTPPSEGVPIARLLDILKRRNLDGVLKEAYFEGPIEILRDDRLVAHAEALYVDCATGNSKIVRAQLNLFGEDLGQDFERLVVRADLITQSDNGVLLANAATVTTSPFAKPSLVVETGDLRIVPDPETDGKEYQVFLSQNRIRFGQNGWSFPLPPLAFNADQEFQPVWPTARLASSARLGTVLTLGFSRPLPETLGNTLHDALGGEEEDPYDANFSLHASYLSGRGGLFDIGVDVEAAEKYKVDTVFGVVLDDSQDEGYIQVPQEDRGNLRSWFRAHSRFEMDRGEWLDIEPSYQSDAGVQSEFWENEFEHYERDESYVQWRKARGETYYQATAKARLDSFRSTIEELPSLGAHLGQRPVFDIGPQQVLWDGSLQTAFLRRRSGEILGQSPLADTPLLDASDEFADGFGDREILRVDARQRLEVPLDTGILGVRATPFVDGRFRAWNEGVDQESSPTRFLARVGLRLATQIWRLNSNGSMHQLAPFLEVSNSLAEEEAGDLIPFDATELPEGGDGLDLGVRGRLGVREGSPLFDFEVRARHQRDVPTGVRPGWQPLAVFARLDVEPFGAPIQLWHDGRYDLQDGSTRYGLTAMGVRATEDLAFEVGHRLGRNTLDDRIYEAAVLSSQYRWTEKWEFEGRQVFSLLRGNGLDTELILRRYGTDLVFELEFQVREGEGSSVSVSFRPRFGFRSSNVGTIGF